MKNVEINSICNSLNHNAKEQGFCIPNEADAVRLADAFVENFAKSSNLEADMLSPMTWEISGHDNKSDSIGKIQFDAKACTFSVTEGFKGMK